MLSPEAIASSCVALLILTAIMGAILMVFSYVKQKKQQSYFTELHRALKVGARVQFSGGLFGKVVRVGQNTCDIEIKSGQVIEVSRFAIQSIESK